MNRLIIVENNIESMIDYLVGVVSINENCISKIFNDAISVTYIDPDQRDFIRDKILQYYDTSQLVINKSLYVQHQLKEGDFYLINDGSNLTLDSYVIDDSVDKKVCQLRKVDVASKYIKVVCAGIDLYIPKYFIEKNLSKDIVDLRLYFEKSIVLNRK